MDDKTDMIRANLKNAIKESGLSKLKVTKIAGISYQHLANFLNNSHGGELGLGILYKLSAALNVPVSYFLGETDSKGELIKTIDGTRLPEKWDCVIKDAVKLPDAQQDIIIESINITLKALKN